MAFYLEKPIAHRGYHGAPDAPENSMRAFELAIENGFAIELDIHLTKEKIPVVFHDEYLERLTGSGGKISNYTLASLNELRLNNTDQKIPTLQEVLDFVGGRTPIIIEIKCLEHDGEIEAQAMKLLIAYKGDYTIQSFNPLTLKWLREHYPFLVLGLLVTNDFENSRLSFLKKFAVRYMTFIPVTRPDYIGLDYRSFSILQYFIIKKLTLSKIIFWTIDSESLYNESRELCDNVIFEQFNPLEIS